MKRGSISAIVMTMLFLITAVDFAGSPIAAVPEARSGLMDEGFTEAGQPAYTGTGAARTATLKGLVTNTSAGPLIIDTASADYARVNVPSGWTGTYVRSDINMMSMWSDDELNNGKLDTYHDELWLGMNYDSEAVAVPNLWTLVKSESGTGSGRELHPLHGIFELNAWSGDGYGGSGSMGWLFEAAWASANVLTANDEVYLSQQVEVAHRDLFSAKVTFMYNVYSSSSMLNQTHLFVRIGSSVTKLYVFESTDVQSTWLQASVDIPVSAFLTTTVPCQLLLDVGLATDLSGSQANARTSQVFIDEIQFLLQVRPFPEQIALKANGTALAGSTSGSVSPYVPDGANRDCYDDVSTGVDLDGYSNNGILDVGHWDTTWNVASTFQVGFQFQLSIPKGAGITSAYLEVEAAETSYTPGMRIYVADADTVSAFTSGLPHLESRYTWVQTSIDWNPTAWTTDVRYASPDISSLIEKVVTRSGWASGNYIFLMLNFTYSTYYQCYNGIKGTSAYDGVDLARLFVNYVTAGATPEKYTASGTWTGPRALSVTYTTTSKPVVTLDTATSVNVTTTLSSLDNSNSVGTTFSVSNASSVTWTGNVLVSPPAGVGYTNISFSKPSTWTFVSLTDADGSTRTSEVTTTTTEVRVKSSVVDVFGIWRFVFTASDGATNLQCGVNAGSYASTYTYTVGSSACFRGAAPPTANSVERLLLTAPNGQLFYAADNISQDSSGYFTWTGITVTGSWAAGVWSADVNLNNTRGAYPSITGRYSRTFTVVHATSLVLQSPVSQTSTKTAGDLLYVEVKLTDTDNLALIGGATVTMNWTVSGTPTVKTLDDFGNGLYGKTLNTTDLGTAKRWRIQLSASRQYYTGSTTYFNLDLCHTTYLTYQTPVSTPYGDDFKVKVNLYDAFSGALISGATITSNATLFGSPTDHGNGSYTVTLETSGLGVGDYLYRINAAPSSTYLLSCSVNIKFTLRNIFTATFFVGGSGVSTPYSVSSSKVITYNDTDHASAGIAGAGNSVQSPSGIVATVSDSGGGRYTVNINVGTKSIGTYLINVTLSKTSYYSSTIRISLTITAHNTYIVAKYTTPVPWGFSSPFTVSWYDADASGANISGSVAVSSVTVNGQSYGSSLSFTYISSSLTVGSYNLNVTVNSGNANYKSSWEVVTIVVRAHYTTIAAVVGNSTPWGFNTVVTVTFWDTDAGVQVPLANVSTIVYTPTGYAVQTPTKSYTPTLTTNTWGVGVVSTTVSATCVLSNKFYTSAVNSFIISIRAHHTTVSAVTGSSTPWGFNTPVMVTFWDSDTGSEVPLANVSTIQYSPTGYAVQTPTKSYTPTLTTNTWTVGAVSTGISVSCVDSNKHYNTASSSFVITVRSHHTSLSASVIGPTAWGFNTAANVVFWDTDSNSQVPLANVSTIQYSPTGYSVQSPTKSYSPTLTTSSWAVGTVLTGISASCMSSNAYYEAASSTFNIVIRAHRTSVSAKGGMTSPYGNNTPVSVVFWDLDSDVQVSLANVSAGGVSFNAGALGTQSFSTYTPTLLTGTWSVGTHSVTLTVTCVQTNKFYDTASYTFTITIRSLGVYLYHEPSDLVFPSGDSFTIVLRINVSEPGNQYNGNPIIGLTAGEFTVTNSTYTFPKTIAGLGAGRYNLTISSSYLNMNAYTITVVVDPTSLNYATASIVISFSYRPARSYLSSPSYPHVTTPYGIDIAISLNYTDVDRNKGIITAAVSAQGISIYGIQNLGNGIYRVTLNVTGLSKGDHLFNISASAPQYETKILTFTLTVRIAYTSAIPTVGSLDIPVGNSPIFFVRFWDTDRDQPVTSASMTSSWIRTLTAIYLPAEQRYQVQFVTLDTDELRPNLVVRFNFSYGENYQFGIFNITVTIRTHSTEFRLVSAVQPTSYNGMINISLYYGDLDNNAGIDSGLVSHKVKNSTGLVLSSLINSGSGYYVVRVSASQFRSLGLQTLTVYFNWTGSIYKYYNKTVVAGANIIGEDSKYTLLQASEPTPYLDNMSYTFLYAELYSGTGITNATQNVFISVMFQGESADLSKVNIWETNRGTSPGYYSIRFNTTLFAHTGLIYMNVFINWSKGVSPFYTNRTDVISVRILARDTLVSIFPPSPTAWGENATFSFTYDDVTGGGSEPIGIDAKMTISLSLSSFTLTYNSLTKTFSVSFSTSQSPIGDAPIGSKSFILNVRWAGSPYYANRTGLSVTITVIARQTVLDYQSPAPTQYLDNVTFIVTWTDVTASPVGITGATVTLYDGVTPVSATKYKVTPQGGGSYSVQLNTTYKASPGTYSLRIILTRPEFYIPLANSSRPFNIRYRVTLVSAELPGEVPYNSSVVVNVHYRDSLKLTEIGNGSGLTSIRILNGTGWLFTCSWQPAFAYYVLTVYTYNHPELQIGRLYTLHINMTYASQVPFYDWDDTFVSFQLRLRVTTLSASAPTSTPYLNYANFTIDYLDVDAGGMGIGSASISIRKGGVLLLLGTEYLATENSPGVWAISVNTTALGGLSTWQVVVYATWYGRPYYSNRTQSVDIPVIRRPTSVDILVPPSLTRYLDSVMFTIAYVDSGRGYYISGVSDKILILNGTKYLSSGQYTVVAGTFPGTFDIRINSTILSARLLTNYQLIVKVYWLISVPYYANSTTTVRVTTTNRVGTLTWNPIDNTPLGDLMNLTFYYKDSDTGAGIANAIVQFDCVQKPGLQVGVDYTIEKGTGASTGTYIVRVDTERLLGIRTYAFTLTVLWSPTTVPYYSNQTPRSIGGTVRIISASLTTGLPTPSTVPYYEIVSIDVTFDDADHLRPIPGVTKSNVSVTYVPGAQPEVWGFSELGGGVYRITVNISDSGLAGLKSLKIAFNWYPYTVLERQVQFQVRYRNGALSAPSTLPPFYAGDPSFIVLNLTDIDGGKPLAGGTLAITWGSTSSWQYIGSGLYNVSFATLGMPAGSRTMQIQASKANFTIQLLMVDVYLRAVPMAILPGEDLDGKSVYWGSTIVIHVLMNDTLHGVPITGVTVTYTFGQNSGSLAPTSPSGNYSAVIDTSLVAWGATIVQIRAEKDNYALAEAQITLNVERLPTYLTSDAYAIDLPRGTPWVIIVYLNDTYNNQPVIGATLRIYWSYGIPQSDYVTPLGLGYYQYSLATASANVGTTYTISIVATKANYLNALTTLTLTVTATPTFTRPDSETSTYDNRTFYWSEIVRVGVLVTANLSPLDVDYYRNDVVVTWQSPGGLGGTFTRDSDGHYTYVLNTSLLSAVTYTLWITSSSASNPAFTDSSMVVTIVITRIPTLVSSPSSQERYWGWSGWFVFNYTNPVTNASIGNVSYGHAVSATYLWDNVQYDAVYWGNGQYAIFINTTDVLPSTQAIKLEFRYDNYIPSSGSFNLVVKGIPTNIRVYYQNGIYNPDTGMYRVAYGDDLVLIFFYNATVSSNDTPFFGGIENASWSGDYGFPALIPPDALAGSVNITPLAGGNYSLVFRSANYRIHTSPYRLNIMAYLANRDAKTIDVFIKVESIDTDLTIEGMQGNSLSMSYGDTRTLTLLYYDNWTLHNRPGISGGYVEPRIGSSVLVISTSELGNGRYELTIFADPGWIPVFLQENRLYVDIQLSALNYANITKTITVVVTPTEIQKTLTAAVNYGFPIFFVAMTALLLWVRVFSVPKRLRQINAQIKALRKGRMPKPVGEAKSREQLVADLFNDTFAELSLTRTADQMPAESVTIAIPEMGELLVQLSLLTHLNQQELDDFKADISKMKMSEQAAFVKEVITQEALRVARREGKTVEQVLAGLKSQTTKRLGEEKPVEEVPEEAAEEPVILKREAKVVEKVPAPSERVTPRPTRPVGEEAAPVGDKLSPFELAELKKQLEAKGVPANEIDTIMEQAKQLPRDLVEELVKSITGGG